MSVAASKRRRRPSTIQRRGQTSSQRKPIMAYYPDLSDYEYRFPMFAHARARYMRRIVAAGPSLMPTGFAARRRRCEPLWAAANARGHTPPRVSSRNRFSGVNRCKTSGHAYISNTHASPGRPIGGRSRPPHRSNRIRPPQARDAGDRALGDRSRDALRLTAASGNVSN